MIVNFGFSTAILALVLATRLLITTPGLISPKLLVAPDGRPIVIALPSYGLYLLGVDGEMRLGR